MPDSCEDDFYDYGNGCFIVRGIKRGFGKSDESESEENDIECKLH